MAVAQASGHSVTMLPAPGTRFTAPADGRLRGQDFAAVVTGVAWPNQVSQNGSNEVPTPGRRFVDFNLQLSEDPSAITPVGNDPAVMAAVQWGTSSFALPLTSIDTAITNQAAQSSWATGSAAYVASVPSRAHDVDLVVSQGSFSQSFNLWTLRRNPPAPTVLYRDPAHPTLSSTASASATLALSNPADGYGVTDQLRLQSAALSYFGPADATNPPASPSQAVLSVAMDSEYPELSPSDPDWGHYLQADAPVPANLVTFTPSGATPIAATVSRSGDTMGKGNNDDGLFDATYSFVVPASLTTGAVTIGAGSFTGSEYTGFVGAGPTTLQLGAANLAVTFPAVPVAVVQKKPPWDGAPLPPTAVAAASPTGSSANPPSGGFPIWLGVLIVAALVAALGTADVLRRRRRARSSTQASAHSADAIPTVATPTVATPTNAEPTAARPAAPAIANGAEPAPNPFTWPVAPDLGADGSLVYGVLGPITVAGAQFDGELLKELGCFLALHPGCPVTLDEIALALWPTGGERDEPSRPSLHTYMSRLRRAVGKDRLSDAAPGRGYTLTGCATDWALFHDLSTRADRAGESEAVVLRATALSLVRGVPFFAVPRGQYGWALSEGLVDEMTVAITRCAHALGTQFLTRGDLGHARRATSIGLSVSSDEFDLLGDLYRGSLDSGDPSEQGRARARIIQSLGAEEAEHLFAAADGLHRSSS